jgi:hypothetical protein
MSLSHRSVTLTSTVSTRDRAIMIPTLPRRVCSHIVFCAMKVVRKTGFDSRALMPNWCYFAMTYAGEVCIGTTELQTSLNVQCRITRIPLLQNF